MMYADKNWDSSTINIYFLVSDIKLFFHKTAICRKIVEKNVFQRFCSFLDMFIVR